MTEEKEPMTINQIAINMKKKEIEGLESDIRDKEREINQVRKEIDFLIEIAGVSQEHGLGEELVLTPAQFKALVTHRGEKANV